MKRQALSISLRLGERLRQLPKDIELMALSWCDLADLGALAQVSQSMKLAVVQALGRADVIKEQLELPTNDGEKKNAERERILQMAGKLQQKTEEKARKEKEKKSEWDDELHYALLALKLLSLTAGRLRHLHIDIDHMSRAFEAKFRDLVAAVIAKHSATFERLTGNWISEAECCFLHSRLAHCPNLRSLSLLDPIGAKATVVLQRAVQFRLPLTDLDLRTHVSESVLVQLLPLCRLQRLSMYQMSLAIVGALAAGDCSGLRWLRITLHPRPGVAGPEWLTIPTDARRPLRELLAGLPALEEVDIPCISIPKQPLSLPALTKLELDMTRHFNYVIATALRSFNGHITSLQLSLLTLSSRLEQLHIQGRRSRLRLNATCLVNGVWPKLRSLRCDARVTLTEWLPAFASWSLLREASLTLNTRPVPADAPQYILKHAQQLESLYLSFSTRQQADQLANKLKQSEQRPHLLLDASERFSANSLTKLSTDIGDDSLFAQAHFPVLTQLYIHGPVASFKTFGVCVEAGAESAAAVMPSLRELTWQCLAVDERAIQLLRDTHTHSKLCAAEGFDEWWMSEEELNRYCDETDFAGGRDGDLDLDSDREIDDGDGGVHDVDTRDLTSNA